MTKLETAILACLADPRGKEPRMMTSLELLGDERLASFWFLRGRLYPALRKLEDDGAIFVAQRDLIVPERGGHPRKYYALPPEEKHGP